ncbi:esterase/lipase family protein [Rhodovulum sp. YNF3179]|uniref:esterase/lipase family protein n=1 Tax=Rhodovulum sp. YNF3179 TaxID=3425127 RepID=UPI003D32BC85
MLILFLGLPAGPAVADCVVLLHGLARSSASLVVMELSLEQAGYRTVNRSYPSTDATVGRLALTAIPEALAACGTERPVHFVTHSMGGLLARAYLQDREIAGLGRIVMLAPPNQGSALTDEMRDWPVIADLHGPAFDQLGTGPGSLPNRLAPVTAAEIGVIAGSVSLNPVLSEMIPGADDGKVSVASTRLEGMDDHIVLSVSHTFMMNNPLVIAQVLTFLETGRFEHGLTLGEVIQRQFTGR